MNENDINLILRRAKRANSTVLDLSNKSLNSIPSDIFEYNIITKLNLSNNKLSDIDPAIRNLKNLKEIVGMLQKETKMGICGKTIGMMMM